MIWWIMMQQTNRLIGQIIFNCIEELISNEENRLDMNLSPTIGTNTIYSFYVACQFDGLLFVSS